MISNDSPASHAVTEHRFLSFDGTPLYFRRSLPAGAVRGVLFLIHGMGEHGGRYLPLARCLADAGLVSYLPDLRGFGQSGGKRGCVRSFSDYFADLEGLRRLAAGWEPREEPFLLGHSFGGLVAASWLTRPEGARFRGLILSSPNFGIGLHVPFWRHALAYAGSLLTPDFTQDNRVDPAFLTHDREIAQKAAHDKAMHHRISARLYTELVAQIGRSGQIASQLRLPTLVLQAGDDRVVSVKGTRAFFDRLAAPDKEIKIYPGFYHEILNELGRQAVFDLIRDWLLSRA